MPNSVLMLRIAALVLYICVCSGTYAQVTFQRDHGSPTKGESGYSVVQSPDGGYYVAGGIGVSGSYAAGCLLRTNALGDTLWWREYNATGSSDVGFNHLMRASTGKFLLTGVVNYGLVGGFSDYDAYLVLVDTTGGQLWGTAVGGPFKHWGYQSRETLDGGYICAGWGQAIPGPESDFYVVRLNALGDTLWTRSYGTPNDPQTAYAIEGFTDSTWVVVGKTKPSLSVDHIHAVRINDQGDTLWTRTITALGNCFAEDVETLPNDHAVIAGYSFPGFGCAKPLLLELDENGDMLWFQNYDHGVCEWTQDMCKTTTGYALFGFDSADGLWLTNVDQQGDSLWSRSFSVGTLGNRGYSVEQTSDGGFVMTGLAVFPGNGGADYQIFLIKTDAAGNVITSTEDLELDPSVTATVFPNPTNAAATFQYTTLHAGSFSLRLHDGQGRVVRSLFESEHRGPGQYAEEVDLSGLARGSYTLVLSNGTRAVSVKVIKN